MKCCKKCNKLKPENQFNKNKSYKDELRTDCRECQSKYNKEWFQQNRDVRNAQKLRDQANHRDRVHARNLAYNKVPLEKKCESCSSTENLHRHHPDYTKPLEVITFCETCHLSRKFGGSDE